MPRLKLPAYGKQLLDERRNGVEVLEVALVYGDDWWSIGEPRVCLKPAEYAPGKYDFCMLAGARVSVHDQVNGGIDVDGKFYDLLAEIAKVGALVRVHWPMGTEPPTTTAIEIAGVLLRNNSPDHAWPRWWSDELDRAQRKLLYGWLEDKRKAADGRIAA